MILLGIEVATFGAVFSNCHDLQAGQLAGAVGGALAGMSLVVWKWPDRCDLNSTVPILALLLAPMLTIQHTDFFGSVPRIASGCLAGMSVLAVVSARIGGVPGRRSAWWLLVPATLLAAAAIWQSWPADPYDY